MCWLLVIRQQMQNPPASPWKRAPGDFAVINRILKLALK
jgi:hypothetical protein